MTVTSVRKYPEALTMTITAGLDATRARLAAVGRPAAAGALVGPADPPGHRRRYELVSGGRVTYFMTGPDGEKFHGWGQVLAVEPRCRLELKDSSQHPSWSGMVAIVS